MDLKSRTRQIFNTFLKFSASSSFTIGKSWTRQISHYSIFTFLASSPPPYILIIENFSKSSKISVKFRSSSDIFEDLFLDDQFYKDDLYFWSYGELKFKTKISYFWHFGTFLTESDSLTDRKSVISTQIPQAIVWNWHIYVEMTDWCRTNGWDWRTCLTSKFVLNWRVELTDLCWTD